MKNMFKYISLSLCALAVSFSAFADGDGDSGVEARKTATSNYDGTYTLQLETFVKGQNVTVHSDKPVPTDIVLVLDVSGSMDTTMPATVTYDGTTNYTLDNFYNANTGTTYYLEQRGDNPFTIAVTAWVTTNGNRNGSTRTRTITGSATINDVVYQIVYEHKQTRSNNSWGSDTYTFIEDNVSSHVTDRKLYTRKSTATTMTRMDALKAACKTFVTNIYNNSNDWNTNHPEEQVTHRVSIVQFSGGNGGTSMVVLPLNDGDVTSSYNNTTTGIYSKINSLDANGATWADEGMYYAQQQLGNARADASKIVVFFTDGTPGSNGWTDSSSNRHTGHYVAAKAIGYAKEIKDGGAKIYSVTVLDLSNTSDEYKYLTLLSSAYPNATGSASSYTSVSSTSTAWRNDYPANPDREEEAKYYFQATDAEALNDVFDTISSDIDVPTIPDLDETTQLRDVISEDFVLPVGVEGDNIKVYTQDCTFTDGTDFKFESPMVPFTDAQILWSTNSSNQQVVNVANFNFSDNWCGMDNDEPHLGKKLIIQIIIEQNPDSEGGLVTTNGPGSGIYFGGSRVEPFVVVPATVYADRAIVISKSGMEPGETAIVTVTNTVTGQTWTVILVADENGVGSAEIKVPVTYFEDGQEKFYTYDIAEDNDWAWNFENTAAITGQELYKEVAGQDTRVENFEFDLTGTNNAKNSQLHGSAARENVFEYNGPVQTTPESNN